MKYMLKITLLLIVACFVAACGESEAKKLQKLAAKIEHNKPLIFESFKKHPVNVELKTNDGGKLKIGTLGQGLTALVSEMRTSCESRYALKNQCLFKMANNIHSTDNNVWIIEVIYFSTKEENGLTIYFKIVKDKKRIMAQDVVSCAALDTNLARLLEEKSKTETIDWEKQCAFPIKLEKGLK